LDAGGGGDVHDNIPYGDMDAFLAFSGGARSCPGRHYALREATVALAWLIKDLKFCIDPNFELEIEWKAVVQGPKGGIPAKVSIRT
jgi:cytochrome P450